MKHLILRLVLPLTLISFVTVTKWWHVKIDGPEIYLYGFPFPYRGPGLHTSMSTHFFILQFMADLLFYFSLVTLAVYSFYRFNKQFKVNKWAAILLWVIVVTVSALPLLFATMTENIFSLYGEDLHYYEIVATGISFFTDDGHYYPY